MTDFDIIIIGNGIAAKCFLLELASAKINKNIRVLQLYSDEKQVPCSIRSTGIVALNGTKKGTSVLGDLIVDSYELTKDFFEKNSPDGVSKAINYHICGEEGPSELLDRYGSALAKDGLDEIGYLFKGKELLQIQSAYLINTEKFLPWMDSEINDSLSKNSKITLVKRSESVTKIDQKNNRYKLETESGAEMEGDILLVCTGAYTKLSNELFPKVDSINRSKVVEGGYLQFSEIDFGTKDFVISRNFKNLIYRHSDKTFMIGPMACDGEIELSEFKALKEEYLSIQKLFVKGPPYWPEFKMGELFIGKRHKGIKRKPFWGKISDLDSPPMFGIFSLYKNGFTFPFQGAKDIVPQVISTF